MSVEQLVREAEAERERVRREVTAFFERTQRREIAISHHPAQEKLPVGASKFYGTPDLPADFDWPYYKGTDFEGVTKNRPLAFLAQINLGEAAPYDRTGLLPKTGVLSFFYETVSMEWGFELKSEGYARVYYFLETEGLVPTQIPEETDLCGCRQSSVVFCIQPQLRQRGGLGYLQRTAGGVRIRCCRSRGQSHEDARLCRRDSE